MTGQSALFAVKPVLLLANFRLQFMRRVGHEELAQNELLGHFRGVRIVPRSLLLFQVLPCRSFDLFMEIGSRLEFYFSLGHRVLWVCPGDGEVVFSVHELASLLKQSVRPIGSAFFDIPEEILLNAVFDGLFGVAALLRVELAVSVFVEDFGNDEVSASDDAVVWVRECRLLSRS